MFPHILWLPSRNNQPYCLSEYDPRPTVRSDSSLSGRGEYIKGFTGALVKLPCMLFTRNMKLTPQLLSVLLTVGSASAHTIFQELFVNGVDQGELTGIRAPDYDGV